MKLLKSRKLPGKKTARVAQLKLSRRRRLLGALTALLTAVVFLLVILSSLKPKAASAQDPIAEAQVQGVEAQDLIQQAWDRAKESGSYAFDADITQIQRPLASVLNVGKTTKRDNLYLEGITNLAEQSLEMTLWSQGGTVQDKNTGAQIRIEGDTAYARQGDQPWEEVNNFTGLFAPNNDFMGYLVAATNVQNLGQETRAGIPFTRLTFDIDGLAYAHVIRDQMQAEMAQRGELLQGQELTLPSVYKDMTGQGELWLDVDGLPLRQLLQLEFAPEGDNQVSAEVSVNFRDFAPVTVAALPANGSPAATTLSRLTTATPAEIDTAVSQFVANNLPLTLIALIFAALFVTTLLYAQRSRNVLAALQLTLIVTILTSPLLQGAHAQQVFGRRQDRVAASEARSQESDMMVALNGSQGGVTAVANPGAIQDILNDSGLDSDNDGYSDVAERFLGTNPKTDPALGKMLPFSTPSLEIPSLELPPNNSLDTDQDGLTDYVEALLGTFHDNADSDGDLITDKQEVFGFSYNNVDWVTDPLEMDTNQDGISDGIEWTLNASGNIPADSDTDGVPDLWDDDNDGDGVPDKLDLSPNTAVDNTFDGDNPFSLVLNGLADDKITYVEFQLRPIITDHLQLIGNAFDWPDDQQGHIQDANHTVDDVRLIPMLEIIVPSTSQNLLPTDVLKQYSIFPQPLPDENTAVYVPLNLVRDPQGSRAVAFNGKMIYNSNINWGAAHQVRLVWLVDMQNDECTAFDSSGLCSTYASFDQSQIIHTYDDDWKLTGFSVRENHWTDIATVYQDLDAVTGDDTDETPIWQLSSGLDHSFIAGGVITGTNRLWDIPEIATRFDNATNGSVDIEQRWNISNTLSVETALGYEHLDQALMTTVQTTTLAILDNEFTSDWSAANPISPTLLFARQDQYRSFNLDEAALKPDTADWGQTAEDANHLNLNIYETAVPTEIASTLSWAPYLYDDLEMSWKSYPIEQYWDYLGQKLAPEMLAEYNDPEAAGGATLLAQIYYTAVANGLHKLVKIGEQRLEQSFFYEDRQIGTSLALVGRTGAVILIKALLEFVNVEFATLKAIFVTVRDSSKFRAANPIGAVFKQGIFNSLAGNNPGLLRMGAAGVVTFLVVVAIVAAITLWSAQALSTSPNSESRIALAALVGAVTFYLGVVGPLYAMRALAATYIKAAAQSNIILSRGAALSKAALSSDSISFGARVAATAALVITIAISWGVFLYAVHYGLVTPGSVAFNTLLAQTIAATIIAIIQFVLSLNPIGAIAVAIFGVIDLLLFILGVNFSLNGWITEQLGKALYHFELTVNSDIDTGAPDLDLVNPNGGMVEGAWMAVNMPVTSTIKHKSPQDGWGWRVAPYLPLYYTESNLKSTTFAYTLSPEPDTFDVDRDDMRRQWQTEFDRTYAASPFYRGENMADPTTNITLTAGVNQPLSLYLNNSYALPGVECWTIPIPVPPGYAPVCIDKTIDGSGSSDIGSSILLDVLPATLDEFIAFDWGNNVSFPIQPDWDNDGLRTLELQGNDPDDFQWDSDNDGLSDSYEIAQRAEGLFLDSDSVDSDNDGLSDFDEIRFGTNPGFSDTDQDGLKDGEEVWHLDPNTNTWTGGYTFTVNITATNNSNLPQQTVRVFSDPLKADADEDGMADGLEKALHLEDHVAYPFNPKVFNESPIALYLTFDDADGFVRPNQSVTISATVNNNLASPLFALGNYTLTLPSELGNSQLTNDFNIFQNGTDSIVTTANVSTNNSGPITITADSLARLHNGNLSWSYAWSEIVTNTRTVVGLGVIRYAQITANPAGASKYAIISLEGNGLVSDQAQYDALRVWKNGEVMVSTASSTITKTVATGFPNPDVGHDTKIGESEPAIACNENGLCAEAYVEVAWPQGPQVCSNVFLARVQVLHAADVEGLTVTGEYYLTQNGTKKWGTRSGGDGVFLHDDKTIVVCPADKIRAWEEDDSPNADDDLGFHYLDLTAPHGDIADYNNDDHIQLHYRVLPTAADRYGAIRFTNMISGSITPGPRVFLEFEDGGDRVSQTANPAIATSGSTWLVGFESYGSPTEIHTQLIDNNGSTEKADRLDTDDFNVGKDDHNLSLVWAGNQYIAVWEEDTSPSIDEHSVKMAFLDSQGFVTSRQTVAQNELARQGEMTPDIAYSAEENQSLVVYVSSNRLHGRFIQGNTVGEKFTIGSNDAGAVLRDPNVVYDVINRVWVVNWLHVTPQGTTSKTRALVYNPGANTGRLVAFHEISAPGRDVTDLTCALPNSGQPLNPNIRQQTFCGVVTSDGRLGTNTMQFDSLQLEGTPPWLGGGATLTNQALTSLTVDTLPPTLTFTNLTDGDPVAITEDTFIIGGDANDTTSPIVLIKANIDNTGWQTATDTASWSFAWNNVPNTDRSVPITVVAIDAVDHTVTKTINIYLDRTAPTTTFNQTANQFVTATEGNNDRYHLTFSGTINDIDETVEALISPNGSGWQTATVSGNSWTVDYVLPQFPEDEQDSNLTGDFTLTLRARDSLGNSTDSNAYPVLPFRMDNTPPAAALLDYGPSRGVISDTITLSGIITDPGAVASGIQQLEIDLVPVGQISDTWQTATLANSGAGIANTSWTYAIPSGLEGNYLINLRGTDEQGNQGSQESWFSDWQGEIDTWAPRVEVTATMLYTGTAAKTLFEATVYDRNLTEAGLESPCFVQAADREYETDTLLAGVEPGQDRLVSLHLECQLAGHITTPTSLRIFDTYGHETTQTIIASSSGGALVNVPLTTVQNTSLLSAPLATAQMETQITTQALVSSSLLAATVLTPTNEQVISDISAPIAIEGGAYSVSGLKAIILTINGSAHYTDTWAVSPVITDTQWQTTWTPPGDGVYELVTTVEDWASGLQTDLYPVTIIVDTTPPVVTLATTVLTDSHRLSFSRLELTGTVTDTQGVEAVTVVIDGGSALPADLDGDNWSYVWHLLTDPDNESHTAVITAYDGGNSTSISTNYVVDVIAPKHMTVTTGFSDGSSPIPINAGDTVRDPSVTSLTTEWTAATDGSGVAGYRVGWTNNPTPTLAALTAYADNSSLHSTDVSEATLWFAHSVAIDNVGNSTIQTSGPIVVDAPNTPDYINPSDGLGGIYRGWMDSDCSLVGADYEVARYAPDGSSLNAVQKIYTSWDATHLRLAWTGADWRVDGDLFIYLDTTGGGATTAHNPYGGAGATITLPDEGSGALGADYLIYIEDEGNANLLSWNGSTWVQAQALSAPNFLFTASSTVDTTDLYIPLAWLGSPTRMKLVAVASEEESLRLWAAMPDHNPLNSERAVNPAAITTLDLPFALTQQYEWANVGQSGVCPAAGQFQNADLRFELVSDPAGVSVGFLQHDMPGLMSPNSALDADLDGVIDAALPLDVAPVPVGRDAVVSYTLHYVNNGTSDATGVVADITAVGGLTNLSTPTLNLGAIAANSSGSVSFTAVVDPDLDGDSAEIQLEIADAAHAPFDWLWQQHDIDNAAPTDVEIVSPALYVGIYTSTLRGIVTDLSGVPTITLRIDGTTTQTCVDPTPYDGEWSCLWNANGAAQGTTFTFEAKGTDEWGNTGAYGPAVTLTTDTGLPEITLSQSTISFLNNGRIFPDRSLSGSVTDTFEAGSAEICTSTVDGTQSTCVEVPVTPQGQSSGNWTAIPPIPEGADGETYILSFTGLDTAGNRSVTPITYSVAADVTAPNIQVHNFPTVVTQYTTLVMTGTVSDGSPITRLDMRQYDPSFNQLQVDLGSGPNWSQTTNFYRQGRWSFYIDSRDSYGNHSYVQWQVQVIAPNANLPPIANAGGPYEVVEGQTVILNGSMSDPNGGALTPSWDLDNDNIFEVTGVLSTTFDATNIDGPDQRTINMRVSDGQLETTVSTVVIISNQRPSADAGGPYTVAEGGQLVVSGSGVDIFAGDVLSYSWDLDGDGVFGDVLTATAVYDASNLDGTRLSTVSLQVTDDDGGASIATAPITITNVAPTLSNLAITTVDENGTATLSGNMADASVLDALELIVDWGDGSPITGYDYISGTTSFSETHQYLDDNPSGTPTDAYTVTLTLADDDDGMTIDNAMATVNNVAPTLSNLSITNVDENGTATLTGNLADVGTEDNFTLDVDWGDGTAVSTYTYPAGTTTFNETHQFLDDNINGTPADDYTVSLTLTDDDTGTDVDSIVVTVTNLNPTLSNVVITDVDENGVAMLTGNLADVGTQDNFLLNVDWGDGSAITSFVYAAGATVFTETHRYLDDNPTITPSDQYTVNLILTDDDTGQATDSVVVTVSNVDPVLSNIAITDVDENGLATLTGNLADVGTEDSFTLDVDWGDGTAVDTHTYPAGTAVFTETHQFIDDNPTNTASDPYTVNLTLTDDDTGQTTDSVVITVSNVDPVLSNIKITDVNEDGEATLTGNLADVGTEDSFTLDVDWGDSSPISTYSYPAETAVFTETHRYLDDNPSGTASDPYTVSLTLTDDDTGSKSDSTIVTVTNVAPVLATDVPAQTIQYSDGITDITITGTDVADDPFQVSTSWRVDGGAFVDGLPAGIGLSTNVCLFSGNGRTCTWTLSGIADVPAGLYAIRVTVEDNDLGVTSIDQTIEVLPEDAVLNFDPDNPVAIQVNAPGSNASDPFSLVVTVEELEPDLAAYLAAAGDINLAQVSIVLEPVGPGGPVTGVCVPNLINPVTGYDDVLTVTCSFVDVPVNTYSVAFVVDGGYYTGYSEDVVVIYDPSLGFTTGGGWFYWPGSEDLSNGYPGDKTNFGYTMKYNKPLTSIQGNLLLIRHLPDGSIYRFKSNAIEGLSLGDVGAFGWASFTGKGTYLEPGWLDPIGNHRFIFYVEDHDEPGNGIDRVWVETRDKDDRVIPVMSMLRPGSANAIEINGGNIVVPHTGSTYNQPPNAEFGFAVDGLMVNFTDQSSDQGGQVVSWQWYFGDGSSDTTQNPTYSYATTGTYDVTLTVTDNDDGTDTATHQVTVGSGSGAEMYIGDLSSSSTTGSGNKWNAEVDILVLGELGNPVANAQVFGSWSNGTSGSGSCVTNASGICTITKTNINGNRNSVTFTVDDVTHATLTYHASLNVESSIVVPKP